jgi:hypothetical protein
MSGAKDGRKGRETWEPRILISYTWPRKGREVLLGTGTDRVLLFKVVGVLCDFNFSAMKNRTVGSFGSCTRIRASTKLVHLWI